MMRSRMMNMVVILWGIILYGCGTDLGELSPQSSERVFRDGRLYALNNTKPFFGGVYPRSVFIIYEDQKIFLPPNMTWQGEPTLQGAVLITPEPIPGGTKLDLEVGFVESSLQTKKFSDYFGGPVIIDGDTTIEFYDSEWNYIDFSQILLRVLSGKQDAPHDYGQ